jgi:hypothetical protein
MQNSRSTQKRIVVFKDRRSKQVLKKFEYPESKILNEYFWKKIRMEELTKLLKANDIMAEDVLTVEHIDMIN